MSAKIILENSGGVNPKGGIFAEKCTKIVLNLKDVILFNAEPTPTAVPKIRRDDIPLFRSRTKINVSRIIGL